MNRVFLDANVLFSASITPEGNARAIFELSEDRTTLLATGYVVDEATRNLERKAPSRLSELENLLENVAIVEEPPPRLIEEFAPLVPDRDDAPVLAGAVSGGAELLVTGNERDFLEIVHGDLHPFFVIPVEAGVRHVGNAGLPITRVHPPKAFTSLPSRRPSSNPSRLAPIVFAKPARSVPAPRFAPRRDGGVLRKLPLRGSGGFASSSPPRARRQDGSKYRARNTPGFGKRGGVPGRGRASGGRNANPTSRRRAPSSTTAEGRRDEGAVPSAPWAEAT